MKIVVLLSSVLAICALAAPAQSHFPKPPLPAVTSAPQAKQPTPNMRARIDPVQLQREARELSDLAKSLPADVDQVNHGLLPKDTIDKLKRIEKLSKHMRSEVQP
jgi:hypothetical protein